MKKREKRRDERDYDTTQLRESGHGQMMTRDYSAHFFRWSFARRFITDKHDVLEIGAGQDKPLSKLLNGATNHYKSYVGVDLNKLKPSGNQRNTFFGEFNFIERHKELLKARPGGFDVIVCMEVVEHFHSRFMPKFMKNCFDCLRPGGTMLLSTPAYDGVRMAANHINEMDILTLQNMLRRQGSKSCVDTARSPT